tara:strand:+ start:122 stop:1051 length:930 start_codon:yes stop_codon:yes gene_type:complete
MTFSFIENPAASYFIQNKDQVNEKKKVKLDPVDKDELAGTLDQRDDKDIDNDGDVDKTDKYLHKRRKAISKKSSTEDEPEGDNGKETATMNPKMRGNKKGSEMEAKESRIRTALKTVLERGPGHGHMNNRDSWDEKLKGKGAKDMAADAKAGNPDIDTTRKLSLSDVEAAQKAGPKKAKARPGDSQIGDKNIVKPGTPMVDPAAPKAKALESVSSDWYSTKKSTESIVAAYKSMSEGAQVSSGPAQHALTDDERKDHSDYMKKTHGVKTKYHGEDDLSYHGTKKQVRSALDNHYGKGGDQKEFHPHIYK